jgi:hypothetical protein
MSPARAKSPTSQISAPLVLYAQTVQDLPRYDLLLAASIRLPTVKSFLNVRDV